VLTLGVGSRRDDPADRTDGLEITLTADSVGAQCPSVFDVDLPVIDYLHAQDPHEAHRRIRQARQQAPIAMGPYGPEILAYDLVSRAINSFH
jgi:hypothetical protein